jgi:hypothetical protein
MNREFVHGNSQPFGLRKPVQSHLKSQIDALQRPRGLLDDDVAEAMPLHTTLT